MRGLKSLVAVAVFALSGASYADTITVQWAPSIFAPPGAVNVGTVTHPGGTTGTDAGRFHGTVTATSPAFLASELVDSAANFLAYCHDLAQTIGGTTTYTVSYGASAIMRDFLGAVNSELGGDPFAWLHPADANTAAAIQLGIWEALHNDDFALATGAVKFSAVPAAVALLFQDFVNEMALAGSLNNNLVMTLTHGDRQDVITGHIPPGFLVPEPGTLALLGFAVAAAALARRRRS
ncbi:MAG: PEP-CTERM sorting domain-containing protein [Betaproteobacteria bacterium]